MSTFNATINLGNIGTSLLNFSFSGCTGFNPSITGTTAEKLKNCNYLTGCTALTSYDNTPKSSLVGGTSITLTGLTYDPLVSQINWIHVKAVNVADGNAETAIECDDSKLCQNIQISNIPTFTPTPIPATNTPTPLPATPTPTTPPTLPPTTPPTLPPTIPPTSPPTPTPTNVVNPPTNTPTPIFTILTGVTSGTTLNDACVGGGNLTFYFAGASIQIGETIYVDSGLTTPAPTGYYYYPDYNTIYYAVNGVLQSTPTCPTPTPTTGTIVNAVVSLVDGPTACAGGDYDTDPLDPALNPQFFDLTIYGSNIVNASGIINIPSFLLGDFGLNQVFYVRGRVAPDFYWKKFILDGDPSSGVDTATADGAAVLC